MIITIGRQMGSGGREVGQLLAKKLGIGYYDKELLMEAARRSGLAPEVFERRDEKTPSVFGGMANFAHGFGGCFFYGSSATLPDDRLYQAIADVLLTEAQKSSFVVVGRSADYILRMHPEVVNVFVHAPLEECVRRIKERAPEKLSDKEAEEIAVKTNKLRAEYYNFYTDKTWGQASSYDLSIDSSSLPMEDVVELIAEYVKKRCNG